MKVMKFAVVAAALALAGSVFADAANSLIAFSTKAPGATYRGDTYADGTVVKDGEWYALCWSANDTFGGITTACEPVVAGDKVFLVAPLAKGGHCPEVIFQISSAIAPADGNYFVYLLDTRGTDGAVAKPSASTGKPVLLNGAVSTGTQLTPKSATSGMSISTEVATATSGAAWSESAVADDVGQPVITGFALAGENVLITVTNLNAAVRYNVMSGATPQSIQTMTLDAPFSSENNGVEFVVPKKDGQFFKVVRQPLK